MTSKYPECRLFLGGDFFPRTGNLYDYVIDDSVDYLPADYYEPDYFNIPRNTKDNVINQFGKVLIELCKELDIHFLNGRFTGDRHGEMTCCTPNGSSIVDYMIVSSDLFNNITDFSILNFDESNHFPLTCNINIGKSTGNCTDSNDVNTECELNSVPRFRWTDISSDSFSENINITRSDNGITLNDLYQDILLNRALSCDYIVNTLTSLLQNAAECYVVLKSKINTRKQPQWWDRECHSLKKCKDDKLNMYRSSHTMSTLITHTGSKRNFRQLCKTKKMEFENNLREKLLATRNSPNEFWKIVKKATKIHPIKPNIDPVEWHDYFNELLNRDVTTDQHHHLLVSNFMKHHDDLCNQCNDNLPGILNEFFSEKEIHDCIQKLANKKAAGIDRLIN